VSPRFIVDVDIAAPVARVWRALCDPVEVEAWAGVARASVPDGYPAPGQHARWRTPLGPLSLTLHDRVQGVEEERRLAARLEVGPARIEEEYRLVPTDAGTWLVADYQLAGRRAGLGRLARLLVEGDLRASIGKLKTYCER
jgi:uncharacterized protein YndB with AHSA1/START domain